MKYKIIISFFFTLFSLQLIAQVTPPCEGYEIDTTNLGTTGLVDQSSTYTFSTFNSGDVTRSNDGITSGDDTNISRTNTEINPWWEVDLNDSYLLHSIKIWYPENHYPDGFKNYYILMSEFPFSDHDLNTTLSSPYVEHVFVQSALPSGFEIPLDFRDARYLRIQLDGEGDITVFEIQIPGGSLEEICGNGTDDDCDGKIDCQDSDCAPVIFNVQKTNPTCPICNDGEIQVQAFGENLSFSLDGGDTFESLPPPAQIIILDHLDEGNYDLVVTNGVCTVAYPLNPVALVAPLGNPNDCCDNGGFEFGTFENWTGGLGGRADNGTTTIDNLDIDPAVDPIDPLARFSRHLMISQTSGYTDPIINNLPLFGGGAGMYLVRLGNSDDGAEAERLTYCFEVTDCNSNLYFNYRVMFEDPNHSDSEQPYFQYTIKDETANVQIEQFKKISNDNDDFFMELVRPGNADVLYVDWTCVDIDLSAIVGHEVCVEFITADCSEGGHFGYAYIDDLCNSFEDISPFINLDIDEIVCANESIIIDATSSDSYNQYAWQVCKINEDGEEENCVTMPLTIGQITEILDIETFYTDGEEVFNCDQKYRVTLTLANDCVGTATVSKDFYLDCDDDDFINYYDIITCGEVSGDVTIEGSNNCIGCTFEWLPSGFLNDVTTEFPTILSSVYALALSSDYTVVATNEAGCELREEINIIRFEDLSITAKVEIDHCDYVFFAEITSPEPISYSIFENITFINETQNESYIGVLQNEDEDTISTSLLYKLEGLNFSRNEAIEDIWKVEVGFDSEITVTGNCILEDYLEIPEPTDLYFGALFFDMPNAFTPNGDNISDRFGPWGGYENGDEMNAYAGRMRVWNRWGNLVWDSGLLEAEIGARLDRSSLFWDGTDNAGWWPNPDEIVPPDVYFYHLELENCDNPLGNVNSCTRWCEGTDPVPGESLCTQDDEDDDCDDYFDSNGDFVDARCFGCQSYGDVTLIL